MFVLRRSSSVISFFHPAASLRPSEVEGFQLVVVTDALSSGVTFVEAKTNKGTVTAPPQGETGTVTWSLGAMASQANEVATVTVTVLVRGRTTITNTASAMGAIGDANAANNSASITVSLAPGSSGKKP